MQGGKIVKHAVLHLCPAGAWFLGNQVGNTHKHSPQGVFLVDIKNEAMKQNIKSLFSLSWDSGSLEVKK